MIRDWEGFIKDSMYRMNGAEIDKIKGDNEIIIHDGEDYGTYADGNYLMASKVWEDVQNFDSRDGFIKQASAKSLHRRIPNFN